jgi:voltage-gated potassium channel
MVRPRSALDRFLANPSSLRYATTAIISVYATMVVAGALVMRLFDSEEFETFGEALWFTLQTATTVGYGDTVPEQAVGRIVATVVMLVSIGFVTVVTAVVTSVFVQNAAAHRVDRRSDAAAATLDRVEASLARLEERLATMEMVATRADGPVSGPTPPGR